MLGGDLFNVYKHLKGGCKEDGTRPFLVVPSVHKIQEVPSRHHTAHLYYTGVGALAGCPERLWGLLLGDLQKLPGHGPGQPALGVLT